MKRVSKKKASLTIPWAGELHEVKNVLIKDDDPKSQFVTIYWVDSAGKEHVWGSTSRIVYHMLEAHFTLFTKNGGGKP